MAGRYNCWLRAKLAARIESNGGYHAGLKASYALSWCVRYYGELATPAQVAAGLVENEHFLSGLDLQLRAPNLEELANEAIKSSTPWFYAQECLQDDLTSDEGLRTLSPATAARYGLDYEGPGAESPFRMKLGGYGGGGKHVCLTEFEGVELGMYNPDLAEQVDSHRKPDGLPTLSNRGCRLLMGIMDELDEALTDENAARCGRYYEIDWFARELGCFN